MVKYFFDTLFKGDASQGVIVCLHRKMMPQEFYFLSGEKYSPSLFGIPLVVNLIPGVTTCQDVYRQVWVQVARLVSPLPPQEQAHSSNHAQDCDDSLGYEYPFVLKSVTSGGCWCATCPWDRMCRGCSLPCTNTCLSSPSSFFAIDWDPTALHLRYLAAQVELSNMSILVSVIDQLLPNTILFIKNVAIWFEVRFILQLHLDMIHSDFGVFVDC